MGKLPCLGHPLLALALPCPAHINTVKRNNIRARRRKERSTSTVTARIGSGLIALELKRVGRAHHTQQSESGAQLKPVHCVR